MKFKSIVLWVAGIAIVALGYQKYGWAGIAVVTGGIVFWLLLHYTRVMTVLQRSAHTPIGYVGSAVMLNVKLKKGVNLLHVMALTRSIGMLQTDKDAQPEIYRWQDGGGSHVTCTFMNGKLQCWELFRPTPAEPTTSNDAHSHQQ
jgi:hypothetical protein